MSDPDLQKVLEHLAYDHGVDPAQVEPGSEQAWHADEHQGRDGQVRRHPDPVVDVDHAQL